MANNIETKWNMLLEVYTNMENDHIVINQIFDFLIYVHCLELFY